MSVKVYESNLFSEGSHNHHKIVAVVPPIAKELAAKAIGNTQAKLEALGNIKVVDGGNNETASAFLVSDFGHFHDDQGARGSERMETIAANLCVLSSMGVKGGNTPKPRVHESLDTAMPILVPSAQIVSAQPVQG